MDRGKFITVEGIEGVGKSTNIDFLSSLIEAKGLSVVSTREPGGTPIAERIRALLLEHGEETMTDIAELLLFFAARSLHIHNAIKPALQTGSLRSLNRRQSRLSGQWTWIQPGHHQYTRRLGSGGPAA